MFSLENIAANNGWAMAFAGALIVICGLSVLSFVISQLHKIVSLFDKASSPKPESLAEQVTAPPAAPRLDPTDMAETEKRYRSMAAGMKEPFELNALYQLAAENGLPHIHLSIRGLREAGIIVPAGDGTFTWK